MQVIVVIYYNDKLLVILIILHRLDSATKKIDIANHKTFT